MSAQTDINSSSSGGWDSLPDGPDKNIFEEHLRRIQAITSRGFEFHNCRLFHDQLIQITELEKKNIPIRSYIPGDNYVYPAFCANQKTKLGCAHAGWNTTEGTRSTDAPPRDDIIHAVQNLHKYTPHLMGAEQAKAIIDKVNLLGVTIARLDLEMSSPREKDIMDQHTECVRELFKIAQKIEPLLEQMVQQGIGIVGSSKYFKEFETEYDI
jgi:hypothetical protein